MNADLERLPTGLPRAWGNFLRDWDRSLRSGNYPLTTRCNYVLAASQLARYLGGLPTDLEAEDAAGDPTGVRKEHVEAFQAWMIETRSASTVLNKHKCLQPKTGKKLIPIIRDDDTKKLLDTCKGKTFIHLRDEAIIRLYYNTGARLSEVGTLDLEDVDLNIDSVHYRGKGNEERRARFGPKTARAISRYLHRSTRRRMEAQCRDALPDR